MVTEIEIETRKRELCGRGIGIRELKIQLHQGAKKKKTKKIMKFSRRDLPIVGTASCIYCIAISLCVVYVVVCDAFSTLASSSIAASSKRRNYLLQLPIVAQIRMSSTSADILLDDMMISDDFIDNDDSIVEQDDETLELSTMDTMEVKTRLLDLLPRMTGTPDEFQLVESYVNTLEDRYTPVQTLDFLNLAMSGEWQLLFSTNLLGLSKPNFRLRDLFQRIEANDLNGTIVNEATWDLAQDHDDSSPGPATNFDASGTFSIECSYSINQGARMVLELNDHVINLAKGSTVPKDVEGLVALLYKAIPTELFDPNDHAMDTTYLDGDLRIVRMAGPKFEAVRDIFIRRGSMQINPT